MKKVEEEAKAAFEKAVQDCAYLLDPDAKELAQNFVSLCSAGTWFQFMISVL